MSKLTDFTGGEQLLTKQALLTSTSASNWAIPANFYGDYVRIKGGIGAGGGGESNGADEGGNGGEYVQDLLVDISSYFGAGQVPYQCGSPGAGGNSSNGGNGSATTFASLSLAGGTGGGVSPSIKTGIPAGYSAQGPLGAPPVGPSGISDAKDGAGGLILDDQQWGQGTSQYKANGYGGGGAARTAAGAAGDGIQGAILLEWEETPS